METDFPVVITSAAEVRSLFNHLVLPGVARGEVVEVVLRSSPPSPTSGQPRGALSQTVAYFRSGERVAQAHRFLLRDGSLGGSGLPDPKFVVHDGTILLAE